MVVPMRVGIVAAILASVPAFPAADDHKVRQLEQDVRELQRQVRQLTQRIDQQRPQPPAPSNARSPSSPPPAASSAAPEWVDAAKWRSLKPGMDELEVVRMLGSPTSMRSDGDRRVLLYAFEIGSSGFLAGSVTLVNRSVAEIQTPSLR